jgi:hypothetical protein
LVLPGVGLNGVRLKPYPTLRGKERDVGGIERWI